MATSRRGGLLRQPETPHFVRTVLPELLCLGKLEIPKAFIRKYGKDLMNWVLLKIPTGETWTIELERDDERVWLGRGWKSFMEHNSILADYNIAFGFVGHCTFHTFICDEDGYQIDHPIGAGCSSPVISNGDPTSSAEVYSEFEISDEVDRDYAAFLSATQATERSGRGRRTRIRNEAVVATSPFTSHIVDTGSLDEVQLEPSDEDDPDLATFLRATRRCRRSGCARNQDPSEAFVAASMFTSYNPFFLVEVQTAAVAKGTVAEGIMERRDLKSGLNDVTIEYQGWLWTVTVKVCGAHGTLCGGWKNFMRNISLQVGDVCVLELVARKRFKVVVFKCMQ